MATASSSTPGQWRMKDSFRSDEMGIFESTPANWWSAKDRNDQVGEVLLLVDLDLASSFFDFFLSWNHFLKIGKIPADFWTFYCLTKIDFQKAESKKTPAFWITRKNPCQLEFFKNHFHRLTWKSKGVQLSFNFFNDWTSGVLKFSNLRAA